MSQKQSTHSSLSSEVEPCRSTQRRRGRSWPATTVAVFATAVAAICSTSFRPLEVSSFETVSAVCRRRRQSTFASSYRGTEGLCASATPAGGSSSSSVEPTDEITQRLERARKLLEKSKAKLAAKESSVTGKHQHGAVKQQQHCGAIENGASSAGLPFFATRIVSPTAVTAKRERVIKSKNEETGLITTDGEKMAAISEEEEWERRSLLEVFENEIEENEDVYSMASQQLAQRDVAASVWNLRKTLQTEDYRKIFDKKNRFIGEDT